VRVTQRASPMHPRFCAPSFAKLRAAMQPKRRDRPELATQFIGQVLPLSSLAASLHLYSTAGHCRGMAEACYAVGTRSILLGDAYAHR